MGDFLNVVTDTVRASAAQVGDGTVSTTDVRSSDARQAVALIDVASFAVGASYTGNGTTDLDFATGPDTITRVGGSFITDGFAVGNVIVVTGSASNNGTYNVTSVTALVLGVAETLTGELNVAATVEIQGGPLTVSLQVSDSKDGTGTWYPAPATTNLVISTAGQYSLLLGDDGTDGIEAVAPGGSVRVQGANAGGTVTWEGKIMRHI